MPTLEFAQPVRLAIQFVEGELYHPNSRLRQPFWGAFDWFTAIKPSFIKVIRSAPDESFPIYMELNVGEPFTVGRELDRALRLRRQVDFFVKDQVVVTVFLEGVRGRLAENLPVQTYWRVSSFVYSLGKTGSNAAAAWGGHKLPDTGYAGLPLLSTARA